MDAALVAVFQVPSAGTTDSESVSLPVLPEGVKPSTYCLDNLADKAASVRPLEPGICHAWT